MTAAVWAEGAVPNSAIDVDAGGTNADSSAWTGLVQTSAGTWSASNTIASAVTLDDEVGDSPTLTWIDADNKTLVIKKQDDGTASFTNNEGAFAFLATNDTSDYLHIKTASDIPEIDTTGTTALNISADGGNINLRPDGDDDDYLSIDCTTNKVTIAIVGEGGLDIDALNTAAASTITLENSDGTYVANVVVEGDLTISGDDLLMGTNTDTFILVADGTNFNPVEMTGDATIDNTGVVTVADDSHAHIYSDIDATTSANWIGRVSDETGTGKWVFGTSPTFTTSISVGATNPADAGAIRMENTGTIVFEDTEGDSEVTAVTVDASENLILGHANATTMVLLAGGDIQLH